MPVPDPTSQQILSAEAIMQYGDALQHSPIINAIVAYVFGFATREFVQFLDIILRYLRKKLGVNGEG